MAMLHRFGAVLLILFLSSVASAQQHSVTLAAARWEGPTRLVATVVNDGMSPESYEFAAGSILHTRDRRWQWYILVRDVFLSLEVGASREIALHVVCGARGLETPPKSAAYELIWDPERRHLAQSIGRTYGAWSKLSETGALAAEPDSVREGLLQWAVWAERGSTFGELAAALGHQAESKPISPAVVGAVGQAVLEVLETARSPSRFAWAEAVRRIEVDPAPTLDFVRQYDLFWKLPCVINLQVHDGQADPSAVGEGPGESPDMEETRGAFSVANLNDTDGDRFLDFVDGQVSGGERSEVDLMQLVLNPPFPNLGGSVDLTLNQGDAWVKLWKDSTKAAGEETRRRFPVNELPLTLWVEGRRPSDAVRALEMRLSYRDSCEDVVRATFVWADNPDGLHDRSANVVARWPDFTNPPRALLLAFGGVGLQPLTAARAGNGIAIRTRVLPIGIRGEADVRFDMTRQIHRAWFTRNAGTDSPHATKMMPAGTTVTAIERANDDLGAHEESARPSAPHGFFSIDTPGPSHDRVLITAVGTPDEFLYIANFYEYIRVGIGRRPAGNTVSGSRGSPKYAWHTRQRLLNTTGRWVRSTGNAESTENDIAFGHITVP